MRGACFSGDILLNIGFNIRAPRSLTGNSELCVLFMLLIGGRIFYLDSHKTAHVIN
jgi:hypothetical protein